MTCIDQSGTAELDCDEVVPQVGEVCAALQHSVTRHLCQRLQRAVEFLNYKEIKVRV